MYICCKTTNKKILTCIAHCKDKIPKFRNKYSQKRNIGVSVPISTFMCLWAIYIFPRTVCLFCWRKYVDLSWDYINRSQTHECWKLGLKLPRKGIHKWDFHCSASSWQFSWEASTGPKGSSSSSSPSAFPEKSQKQLWYKSSLWKGSWIIQIKLFEVGCY